MGTGAQTPKRLLLNIRNIIIVILTPIVLLPLILFVDGNVSNNIFTFHFFIYLVLLYKYMVLHVVYFLSFKNISLKQK